MHLGEFAMLGVEGLRARVAGDPSADNYFYLGLALGDEGDIRGAQTAFEECLRIDPNHLEAKAHLADTYRDLGIPASEELETLLDQSLGAPQRSRSSAAALALVRLQLGKSEKAAELIPRLFEDLILTRDPTVDEALTELSLIDTIVIDRPTPFHKPLVDKRGFVIHYGKEQTLAARVRKFASLAAEHDAIVLLTYRNRTQLPELHQEEVAEYLFNQLNCKADKTLLVWHHEVVTPVHLTGQKFGVQTEYRYYGQNRDAIDRLRAYGTHFPGWPDCPATSVPASLQRWLEINLHIDGEGRLRPTWAARLLGENASYFMRIDRPEALEQVDVTEGFEQLTGFRVIWPRRPPGPGETWTVERLP